MAGRLRRIAPFVPPAAFLLGLFLFGLSLLMLGTQATDEGEFALEPGSLVVANGSAVLVYPTEYIGLRTERIVVQYAFPQGIGDAYFLGCEDTANMTRGNAVESPMLAFERLREGRFNVSRQTVAASDRSYIIEDGYYVRCDPAVVFRWDAPDADPSANRPDARVLYQSAQLDGENFALLAILMGGSALLALFGGLAWARGRAREAPLPPEDASTVEALRSSLDRMRLQMERTRKHMLMAGVLGVFLWYPFLVPWAWIQADRSSDDAFVPWGVATLTLLFLLALTALWAREFLRLDRELNAWRGRLGELRDREEHLLHSLEQQGG